MTNTGKTLNLYYVKASTCRPFYLNDMSIFPIPSEIYYDKIYFLIFPQKKLSMHV